MKRKHWRPEVSIPSWAMLSWASQANQYPPFGEAGISYFRGDLSEDLYVDCLLWRDDGGILRGILNHYPIKTSWEEVGNANVWVQPGWERRGIGTALITEALRRWTLDFTQQRYSPEGAALIEGLMRKGVLG